MENGKWKWIVRNSSNHSHHEADGDHFNFNWNGAIHATGNTHSIRICVKSYFVWCCLWFFKKIIILYSCDTYFIYSILIMMEKKDHMNWFSLDFWLHLVWHRQTQIHICIQYRLTVFSITEIAVEILIGWCNQFLFHTICIQSLFFVIWKIVVLLSALVESVLKILECILCLIWFAIGTVIIALIVEEQL